MNELRKLSGSVPELGFWRSSGGSSETRAELRAGKLTVGNYSAQRNIRLQGSKLRIDYVNYGIKVKC